MEFYGIITNIIGFPGRPTFVITDFESRKERRIDIIDAHGIRPVGNKCVDLFLNGNLLTDNKPEEVWSLVIVEVRDIKLRHGLFILPDDYMNKKVRVSSPNHLV